MKCVICKHGETKPGKIVVTLVRNSSTIVFKDVPAEVCDNCGEAYLNEMVSVTLSDTAGKAIQSGIEVDIRQYKAA